MSLAMGGCGISWHTHDPGVVLTHLAVAIADGADCLSHLASLREKQELFGPVAAARERVWAASPPENSLILDFDATLLTSHSDKQDAAPTYKRDFGFHPLGVWCDTTAEPLAAMLRPGNAGSNGAGDHLDLLDQTIAAFPPEHQSGDLPGEVVHPILVRADSAGAPHRFVRGLVEANCEFSIGHPINAQVRGALLLAQEEEWAQAVELDVRDREGAWVIELTDLLDLSAWPEGTRLLCRHECPHPGAQLSLFDIGAGFRHTGVITNTAGGEVAVLKLRHHGHARVEDRVRNWKSCGLQNLPFEDVVRNMAWLQVSLVPGALLAWAQLLCFEGALAKVESKTLRYRIVHVAPIPPRTTPRAPSRSDLAVGRRPRARLRADPHRVRVKDRGGCASPARHDRRRDIREEQGQVGPRHALKSDIVQARSIRQVEKGPADVN
jgi:hypothetical protein